LKTQGEEKANFVENQSDVRIAAESDKVLEVFTPIAKSTSSNAERMVMYELDDLTGGVSRVGSDQNSQSLGLNIFLSSERGSKRSEDCKRYRRRVWAD
jgi:hypothetical protein